MCALECHWRRTQGWDGISIVAVGWSWVFQECARIEDVLHSKAGRTLRPGCEVVLGPRHDDQWQFVGETIEDSSPQGFAHRFKVGRSEFRALTTEDDQFWVEGIDQV